MLDVYITQSDCSGKGESRWIAGVAGKVLLEKWSLSQALKAECDVHGKGTGRGLSPGVHTWALASGRAGEHSEGKGRKSRELVMWSWLEPGLPEGHRPGIESCRHLYNQETTVGNLSALCFMSSIKWGNNDAYLGRLLRRLNEIMCVKHLAHCKGS